MEGQSSAAAKFIFVNGRTPNPESFLRIVLRVDRRKLPARPQYPSLLLRSHVLSRPPSARSVSTQATREGLMTILRVTYEPCPAARRDLQLCDHCSGPFGMVMHRWWGRKFCKRRCKDA
jgi:hypothetical protein